VKLVQRSKGGFVFELQSRERELLFAALDLYPMVPISRHRLNRESAADAPSEHQQWLEQALDEQRAQNRRQIDKFLRSSEHWRDGADRIQLKLKSTELDWLLQVFNDVRVGCWLELGEPDGDNPPQLTGANYQHLVNMEVCGAFESILLSALGLSESPDWAA